MPDLKRQAWRRWQGAAGPWRGWAICPALVAPYVGLPDADAPPSAPVQAIADRLQAGLLPDGGVALVLDLTPPLGIAIAAELNRRRLANAVLVLPRWPYEQAILPVDDMTAVLQQESHHLLAAAFPSVAFVLDAQREQPVRRPSPDGRVDNRYRIAVADLPNLATLRQRGIRRVVKLQNP